MDMISAEAIKCVKEKFRGPKLKGDTSSRRIFLKRFLLTFINKLMMPVLIGVPASAVFVLKLLPNSITDGCEGMNYSAVMQFRIFLNTPYFFIKCDLAGSRHNYLISLINFIKSTVCWISWVMLVLSIQFAKRQQWQSIQEIIFHTQWP